MYIKYVGFTDGEELLVKNVSDEEAEVMLKGNWVPATEEEHREYKRRITYPARGYPL